MDSYHTADGRVWHIYVLKDPDTFCVRYVGWTVDLRRRLRDHMKPSRISGNQRRDRWIASLIGRGVEPIMESVDTGCGEWAAAEIRWIAHYRSIGANLTNHTDGGEGAIGRKHSEEAKRRMSEQRKGKKPSPQALAAYSKKYSGKHRPPEVIAKIRLALTGKTRTQEQCLKISAAAKARKATDETRKKLSLSRKGRIPWNKGIPASAETRAKLSAASLGRPKSVETKLRMSQARIRINNAKRLLSAGSK